MRNASLIIRMLSPCVESCPDPGNIRGSISPYCTLCGAYLLSFMVIKVSSQLRFGLLLHSFPVHHTTCPLYLVYPASKNWHDSHYRSIVGQTAESTMLTPLWTTHAGTWKWLTQMVKLQCKLIMSWYRCVCAITNCHKETDVDCRRHQHSYQRWLKAARHIPIS